MESCPTPPWNCLEPAQSSLERCAARLPLLRLCQKLCNSNTAQRSKTPREELDEHGTQQCPEVCQRSAKPQLSQVSPPPPAAHTRQAGITQQLPRAALRIFLADRLLKRQLTVPALLEHAQQLPKAQPAGITALLTCH